MRIGDGQVITTTIEGVVFIAREIIVLPVEIVNLELYVYETCDQTVEQNARKCNLALWGKLRRNLLLQERLYLFIELFQYIVDRAYIALMRFLSSFISAILSSNLDMATSYRVI